MIPLTWQAWIGAGIAGCLVGIHSLRAEVRAIHVPRLPAKWRKAARGRHRKHWWQRSTMERWALAIQRAQERADIYLEPDWMAELREQWDFGQVDEFDAREVGGAETYERLPWVLDGPITQEFRRLVGSVDVDDWAEPQLAVTR